MSRHWRGLRTEDITSLCGRSELPAATTQKTLFVLILKSISSTTEKIVVSPRHFLPNLVCLCSLICEEKDGTEALRE